MDKAPERQIIIVFRNGINVKLDMHRIDYAGDFMIISYKNIYNPIWLRAVSYFEIIEVKDED